MGESTPKRKRSQRQARDESPSKKSRSPSKINTLFPPSDLHILAPHSSPRTKVAYHFQGLQLSSPISKLELARSPDPNASSPLSPSAEIRKRVKVLEGADGESEIPETPQAPPSFKINIGPERAVDPFIQEKADALTLRNAIDPVIFSAQQHFTSKHRGNGVSKKRSGTPPLSSTSKSQGTYTATTTKTMSPNTSFSSTSSSTSEIFLADPDTADDAPPTSLTWLDSEITGHSPEDPEDDGEGINGIGFKPTAAQAYQRMEKRKQQMAEYRIRETREARAKRGARRRGGSGSDVGVSGGEKDRMRKVRFVVGEDAVNAVNAV